jgi:disulfide bond formation protein DsbB
MSKITNKAIIYIALIQALVATFGSLYLSVILKWQPCLLCWYQRIFMYPLVVIIGVGMILKTKGLKYFVLPLTFIGLLISIYHNLLQYGVIAEKNAVCSIVNPCVTNYHVLSTFITVPLLSMVAFIIISVCLLLYRDEQ